MIKNLSLASITDMLEVAETGYKSLIELAKANSVSIAEIPNSYERLTVLKNTIENILDIFEAPLSSGEFEVQNHAVALLNAVNSALSSNFHMF